MPHRGNTTVSASFYGQPMARRHSTKARMAFVNMVYPTRCPVCRALGPAPCTTCRDALHKPPMLTPPHGLHQCIAVVPYDEAGRAIIHALKFANDRGVIDWLAFELASAAQTLGVDVLTWAPTTPSHRRARGYDQAALLARAVSASAHIPVFPMLRRLPGPSQTGHHFAERLQGPKFQLKRRARGIAHGRTIGLIDDVVTTGATMSNAAHTLMGAVSSTHGTPVDVATPATSWTTNATRIVGLCGARTPRSVRRAPAPSMK